MRFFQALFLASLLALGGCSTFQGLKSDLSAGANSLTRTLSGVVAAPIDPVKEEKKRLPVYDGTCPPVAARPDLTRLVEFYDSGKTSDSSKVSEINIVSVQNTCRVEKDSLVMQVDIVFSGKTGPKARVKPNDQPNFAYPYFVAVTDAAGTVVSKEIFAASISYGRDQNETAQTETIFQNMPFPDVTLGRTFNVVVGFQLTEEQLAYNRDNPAILPVSASAPLSAKPSYTSGN